MFNCETCKWKHLYAHTVLQSSHRHIARSCFWFTTINLMVTHFLWLPTGCHKRKVLCHIKFSQYACLLTHLRRLTQWQWHKFCRQQRQNNWRRCIATNRMITESRVMHVLFSLQLVGCCALLCVAHGSVVVRCSASCACFCDLFSLVVGRCLRSLCLLLPASCCSCVALCMPAWVATLLINKPADY